MVLETNDVSSETVKIVRRVSRGSVAEVLRDAILTFLGFIGDEELNSTITAIWKLDGCSLVLNNSPN